MTMNDGVPRLHDEVTTPAAADEGPIDLSDIPETQPDAAFGTLGDAFARARARARQAVAEGRSPTEGFPTLLALDPGVAERLLALGPDWQARANEALRKAFAGS